jgi:hypothetical protein
MVLANMIMSRGNEINEYVKTSKEAGLRSLVLDNVTLKTLCLTAEQMDKFKSEYLEALNG